MPILRVLAALLLVSAAAAAQAPPQPDVNAVGPAVGERVPAFSAVDQFGATHTLESLMGPKGAMLVFYRSADW